MTLTTDRKAAAGMHHNLRAFRTLAPGKGASMAIQHATTPLVGWPEDSREAAQLVIDTDGQPNEAKPPPAPSPSTRDAYLRFPGQTIALDAQGGPPARPA